MYISLRDLTNVPSFCLQREVTNWNTDFIEGRIRSLLASIGYRGKIIVTFPVSHSQVVVQSAPKVNRFFTNILSSVVETKKYDVVKAYWPYATLGADAAHASAPSGPSSRSCAVQSEEAWWKDWQATIRCGVLARRVGWLSVEDQIELAMSPALDTGEKTKDWGADQ
jgi:hypothetical protein